MSITLFNSLHDAYKETKDMKKPLEQKRGIFCNDCGEGIIPLCPLHAAAPELLGACKAMLSKIRLSPNVSSTMLQEWSDVIAKAEGKITRA